MNVKIHAYTDSGPYFPMYEGTVPAELHARCPDTKPVWWHFIAPNKLDVVRFTEIHEAEKWLYEMEINA